MELTIMNFNGIETVDSRQVAEAVEKNHADLMRDIRKYCGYLNESKIALVDFFIESTYTDGKGETRPCYQITRKGCEMVANKMTGQKGTVFTALYVNAFHAMEQQLQKPTTQLDVLANMANILTGTIDSMKQHEARLTAIETAQAEHERQISELCEFSDSMVKMTCEKYPIRDGAPTVRIEWSEHPTFSDGFTMSISAAQILFSIFDEKQAHDRQKENHSGAWYYKTKFLIEYTDPETGEKSSYTGRQDFGDGEGGILEHMLNHAEWERTHHHDGLHRYGAPVENPPETTDKLDFIKWLSGFLESSTDADSTERPEIALQTSTGNTADTPDSAQAQKQAIAVTFAPELKQAAEKHSENYAECEQIMNDIDTAVSALPPEDIAHILDTLPRDTLGVLMARRICQQYAKTDPANAAMLLGAWILDFTNNDVAAQ